ncbi:MAG: hypothetical protein RMM17_11745 [Acidobacteriota bacterium]|nr:hypothetical protein [Blastocatellia bacterium]MDW8413346.1 hypothetical protein [Acidobacteriota bacterium]
MPYISKPTEAAQTIFEDFLARLEEKIADPALDRNDVVRDVLYEIYLGGALDAKKLYSHRYPVAARALMASFDPRNVGFEDFNVDSQEYSKRRPLIWLWKMFDRSPLGLNHLLGFRLRSMLAKFIFRSVGRDFICFPYVEFKYGYNISVGDGVTLGRHVLLDDRGEIVIGSGAELADYVQVCSEAGESTVIGERVKLGYHSLVPSGRRISNGACLGVMALAPEGM